MPQNYARLPLSFEANQGQAAAQVKYLARAPGLLLAFTPAAALVRMGSASLRMEFLTASPNPLIEPLDPLPGRSNYFLGRNETKWLTGIVHYGRIEYHDLYPGVDLIFYGSQSQLEYDLRLRSGADPDRIRLRLAGAGRVRVDANGDLVMKKGPDEIRQRKPLVYQDGVSIECRYILRGGREIGFKLARHDRSRPVVIDPVLVYSTYLGGSKTDSANAIAVDRQGNAYVTGWTRSVDFPLVKSSRAQGGSTDVFVTKIAADGASIVYSTVLGGDGQDLGLGIAVDAVGNAYITGSTASSQNFPTRKAFQGTGAGKQDAFIAKLDAAGSEIIYATYLGGSGDDSGYGIAVDEKQNAYVTGGTGSRDFPVSTRLQSVFGGGSFDGFLIKINREGSKEYATFLGGSGYDYGKAVAVDSAGSVYIAGTTSSPDYPLARPLQRIQSGPSDAFVTKISADGATRVFSTFFGGSGGEGAAAIALGTTGDAWITGATNSTDLPLANPSQPVLAGGADAFLAGIAADGSRLLYSTYLGGKGDDHGSAIALDASGDIYVAGSTSSPTFPITNSLQSEYSGAQDAFLAKFHATGAPLLLSTYIGGGGFDQASGIAVDRGGNAYVTGSTSSGNFPTRHAFRSALSGAQNGFLSRIYTGRPSAAFRDASGAIVLASISEPPVKSEELFPGDPAAAQTQAGDTFVAVRDTVKALALNLFHAQSQRWEQWTSAGGAFQGTPSIAVQGDTAFIAARSLSNTYWINSFTAGKGFGTWKTLGGMFVTDPVLAADPTRPNLVYVAGKDGSNSIWSGAWDSAGPGAFLGWVPGGASAFGKPSLAAGTDGMAYIAIRDENNAVWMGRASTDRWIGWWAAGGEVISDPEVARVGDDIYVAAPIVNGSVSYNVFTQGTGEPWRGWRSAGGNFQRVTIAADASHFFLTGIDGEGDLWWYDSVAGAWARGAFTDVKFAPPSAAQR